MGAGPLTDSRLRAVAWGLLLFCLALAAGTLVVAGRGGPNPLPPAIGNRSEQLTAMFLQLSFPLVGLLIVTNRPRNLVGWLLLLPPAMLLLASASVIYAAQALVVDPGSLPFGAFAAWIPGWMWPLSLPALPVVLLVYPNGTLPSRRWRSLAWGTVFVGVVVALVGAVSSWSYRGGDLLVALSELIPELRWGYVLLVSYLWFIVAAVGVGLVSLVLRYRRGAREERLQIKWLAVAVTLLVVDGFSSLAFPTDAVWRSIVGDVVFASIPVAIGIAVLKYRLYEIEVIINRTLVYVPLIAIIGGLATAMIPLSQRVFMAVTGNESDAAIVLTTLFVASLVTPVRKRLEGVVEGRFKPSRPDEARLARNRPAGALLDDPEVEARIRSIAEKAALDAVERSRARD